MTADVTIKTLDFILLNILQLYQLFTLYKNVLISIIYSA